MQDLENKEVNQNVNETKELTQNVNETKELTQNVTNISDIYAEIDKQFRKMNEKFNESIKALGVEFIQKFNNVYDVLQNHTITPKMDTVMEPDNEALKIFKENK